MTNDEIIAIAREAGFNPVAYMGGSLDVFVRFAALVAAKEREACADVAEKTVCDTHIPTGIKIYGTRAAKAIRARGKQ